MKRDKLKLEVKLKKLQLLYFFNIEANTDKGLENYVRDRLTCEKSLGRNVKTAMLRLKNLYTFKVIAFNNMKYSQIKVFYYLLATFAICFIGLALFFIDKQSADYSIIVIAPFLFFYFKNQLSTIIYSEEKHALYTQIEMYLSNKIENEKNLNDFLEKLTIENLNIEKIPIKNINQSLLAELVALPFILEILDKKDIKVKGQTWKSIGKFLNEHFYLEDGSKLEEFGKIISAHINETNEKVKTELIKLISDKI